MAGRHTRHPDGTPLRLTLHFPEQVPVAIAELTAAGLKAVGIDIDLQRIDLARVLGVKSQAAFDLLVTSFPGPSGVGPSAGRRKYAVLAYIPRGWRRYHGRRFKLVNGCWPGPRPGERGRVGRDELS